MFDYYSNSERSSYSSEAEARSREQEAPPDQARRSAKAPVREQSVQILLEVSGPEPGASAGQGRGERSRNPDQGYPRNNQTEGPTSGQWAAMTRAVQAHRNEDINRVLQRVALGTTEEQEEQYMRALGDGYQNFRQ